MDDAALSREMLPGRTTGPNEPARPVRRCDPRSRAGEHVLTACGAGARRAIPRKRGPKPDRLRSDCARISAGAASRFTRLSSVTTAGECVLRNAGTVNELGVVTGGVQHHA